MDYALARGFAIRFGKLQRETAIGFTAVMPAGELEVVRQGRSPSGRYKAMAWLGHETEGMDDIAVLKRVSVGSRWRSPIGCGELWFDLYWGFDQRCPLLKVTLMPYPGQAYRGYARARLSWREDGEAVPAAVLVLRGDMPAGAYLDMLQERDLLPQKVYGSASSWEWALRESFRVPLCSSN